MTVYEAVLQLVYIIFPATNGAVSWWGEFISIFSVVVTCIVFYISMLRPFLLFLKTNMFGNSNKSTFLKRNFD